MQPGNTVQPFGQPPTRQPTSLLVDDLDVVMVLGPVITHEQHRVSLRCSPDVGSVEETADDLMVQCSPNEPGHAIPAVVHPLTTSGRTVCRKTSSTGQIR